MMTDAIASCESAFSGQYRRQARRGNRSSFRYRRFNLICSQKRTIGSALSNKTLFIGRRVSHRCRRNRD